MSTRLLSTTRRNKFFITLGLAIILLSTIVNFDEVRISGFLANNNDFYGAALTKTNTRKTSSSSPSSSSIQRLMLQAMLYNMTTTSIEVYLGNGTNYHHVFADDDSSTHVQSSVQVPKDHPDPFPSFMIEYALRNFSISSNNSTTIQQEKFTKTSDPTCSVTSQIELIRRSPSASSPGDDDKWTLKTFDLDGIPKTVGGDEFTVYYIDRNDMSISGRNKTTAVARVMDNDDGTYTLDFHRTPAVSEGKHPKLLQPEPNSISGKGTLVIALVFSCGVGMIEPPVKKEWNTGGMIMSYYHIHNVTMPPGQIQPFVPANRNHAINFTKYDYILVHGDSTMAHFFQGGRQHPSKNMLMWTGNNRHPLYKHSVKQVMDHVSGKMGWMNEDAASKNNNSKTAFIYGSSAWDINIDPNGLHGSNFENEIEACRLLIERFHTKFPTVDLYWRSGLAMHPSLSPLNDNPKMTKWYFDDRNKYMSYGRVQLLHRLQKEMMTNGSLNINVTWLELYEPTFTAIDHHQTHRVKGDAVHYTASFNELMTQWFYLSPPSSS